MLWVESRLCCGWLQLCTYRHTYSIQCGDKIHFLQLCIKCSVAKSCPDPHSSACTYAAHATAFHPQDNPSVPTSNQHSWQNGTRCRDGVKVLWCCSYLVWLVFEDSIPTCACFQLKTFLLLIIVCYIVIFITEMFSSLLTVFDGNCNHLMCTRDFSDITAAYTH